MGYQLIAISPDRPERLRHTAKKLGIEYMLLSDSQVEAASAFGVAFKLDEQLVSSYKRQGLDIEAASGQTHHILPVPAVFVTDAGSRITFSYVNPDYKQRVDPEVLLAAARAAVKDRE